MEHAFPEDGRRRVVVENVAPQIDGGRYAVKRTAGEGVTVEADIFADGHDTLSAVVKYKKVLPPHPALSPDGGEGIDQWQEVAMTLLENDRWRGEFTVDTIGDYEFTVEAWVDHFKSWRRDLKKKLSANQDVAIDLLVGAGLVEAAAKRARTLDADQLSKWAADLRSGTGAASSARLALDDELAALMARYPDRSMATTYGQALRVTVDRERARFGAWYELFPRSFGGLKGCVDQLPRVARMGFDVLYLPPVHPVGKSFRKGRNNRVTAEPGEPGSPWAIGSAEGGHKAVHPELGTLDDFRRLVDEAKKLGIEVALDIAFQCSPDHPYVREHPDWFRHRPDGTIQYAENPPKKYQDIVPFNFECDDWRGLWTELKSVFEFWIGHGVKIFRVDNPHTKTFPFWEWCIGGLKAEHPDLIFLSEAFTRPKVMFNLAKLGFTQSYNYFPWRNTKDELESYLTEITQSPVADFLRANLWPNTPDILTQFLQTDGRAGFAIRYILAATLGASYGIYGPAFELGENTPRGPGEEEYLNSEKYEVRQWDLKASTGLEDLITRVNRIRRENPALQSDCHLRFHHTDNPELIAFTKTNHDKSNTILVIVNLSPHYRHSGWLDLPLADFGLELGRAYQMHDLLTDTRYLWKGEHNYVELNPIFTPAHIFQLRRYVRTERDFDYFT